MLVLRNLNVVEVGVTRRRRFLKKTHGGSTEININRHDREDDGMCSARLTEHFLVLHLLSTLIYLLRCDRFLRSPLGIKPFPIMFFKCNHASRIDTIRGVRLLQELIKLGEEIFTVKLSILIMRTVSLISLILEVEKTTWGGGAEPFLIPFYNLPSSLLSRLV